jgi:polyferredoxin
MTFTDFAEIPFLWFNRIERGYMLTGWALLVMLYWGLGVMRRQNPQLIPILVVVFVASIAWSVVMPQHYVVHLFTVRQFGLWVGLAGGYAVYGYSQRLAADYAAVFPKQKKPNTAQPKLRQVVVIALHGLFLLYVLGMALTQQLIPLVQYSLAYQP